MSESDVIFSGQKLLVRWLLVEGVNLADGFYQGWPADRKKLLNLVEELGDHGRIRNGERGHLLHGKYSALFELKTHKTRALGFQLGTTFYICYAARKVAQKAQMNRDYDRALQIRSDFLTLLKDQADGPKRL